jgi:hypothetical protein
VLQKSFCLADHKFSGCRRGDRILMWGTTSLCGELADDFGGAFEATSTTVLACFCRLAEILPHGVLGLLQHYHPDSGHSCVGLARPKSNNPDIKDANHQKKRAARKRPFNKSGGV